jgi:hypothetical protein
MPHLCLRVAQARIMRAVSSGRRRPRPRAAPAPLLSAQTSCEVFHYAASGTSSIPQGWQQCLHRETSKGVTQGPSKSQSAGRGKGSLDWMLQDPGMGYASMIVSMLS